MKKALALILVVLLFAVPVFAAEGIVWTCKNVFSGGSTWTEISAVITTAADGSVTATQFGGTSGGSGTCYDVRGKYLYQIRSYYGGTAVTADSDLVLYPDNNTAQDILNAAGTNMVDDNTNKSFKPMINGVEAPVPVFGIPYLDILNNIVDSATHAIWFEFIQ